MIHEHIAIILIVTGALTVGAIAFFLIPAALLKVLFGETSHTPAALVITRHWGLLVAGVGVLLICAAQTPELRTSVMTFAVIEKVAIGGLILGTPLRKHGLAAAIAVADLIMALIYVLSLLGL